jgi:hypothetical protein
MGFRYGPTEGAQLIRELARCVLNRRILSIATIIAGGFNAGGRRKMLGFAWAVRGLFSIISRQKNRRGVFKSVADPEGSIKRVDVGKARTSPRTL